MDLEMVKAVVEHCRNGLGHQAFAPEWTREDITDFQAAIQNVPMVIVHKPDSSACIPQNNRPPYVSVRVGHPRAPYVLPDLLDALLRRSVPIPHCFWIRESGKQVVGIILGPGTQEQPGGVQDRHR
jgi:hypothetical protein